MNALKNIGMFDKIKRLFSVKKKDIGMNQEYFIPNYCGERPSKVKMKGIKVNPETGEIDLVSLGEEIDEEKIKAQEKFENFYDESE
jgi:hypothetical protein